MKLHTIKTSTRRFWSKVDKTNSCWLWTDHTTASGYGKFYVNKGEVYAHRHSYEIHRGKIPKGLVIDHLCRVRNCVNPEHMEVVTQRENIVRGLKVTSKKSGLPRGVWKNRDDYRVDKKFGDVRLRVGGFNTPEDASVVYETAVIEQYRELKAEQYEMEAREAKENFETERGENE